MGISSQYVLIDCNNFFVSCERIFNPKLWNKPVVVLSSNDGCIVARSNEAKALGIPMGAPVFKHAETLEKNNVFQMSSNFPLYADISRRVMDILHEFSDAVEVYSVDEAFIKYKPGTKENLKQTFSELRKKIYQWTGIPVSIGIAPTKTLAKVASEKAKKTKELEGVGIWSEFGVHDEVLKAVDVADIWGIGWNHAALLQRHAIFTAYDLTQLSDKTIRKLLTIGGLKTVTELRGTVCIDIETITQPRKGLTSSRSFGRAITTLEELEEAVSLFATRVGTKLFEQKSVALYLSVYIRTSKYNPENRNISKVATVRLDEPTFYIPHIITAAKKALKSIYMDGYTYKKAAVYLQDICPADSAQQSFLGGFEADQRVSKKQEAILSTVERINAKWGSLTIKPLAIGEKQLWKPKQEKVSPAYTTSWNDLVTIRL